MKTLLMISALLLATSIAQASSVKFESAHLVGIESSTTGGVKRIFITATADGKLIINFDEVVDAQVISDRRAADGALELNLGKGRTLVVTSGFSADGLTHYYLKTGTETIELKPNVFLNVK